MALNHFKNVQLKTIEQNRVAEWKFARYYRSQALFEVLYRQTIGYLIYLKIENDLIYCTNTTNPAKLAEKHSNSHYKFVTHYFQQLNRTCIFRPVFGSSTITDSHGFVNSNCAENTKKKQIDVKSFIFYVK